MKAGIANQFYDGSRLTSDRNSRLELAGTIECKAHELKSISWSPDGKHVATITNDTICVWRLPGKLRLKEQPHGNNAVDAVYSLHNKTEDNVTIESKVGYNADTSCERAGL
jgi:hypothetical protein